MSIKPEDVLADGVEGANFSGQYVRKGSIAALLANIVVFSSKDSTPAEKADAKKMIGELFPALIALGGSDLIAFKNPEVQGMFEEVIEKIKK